MTFAIRIWYAQPAELASSRTGSATTSRSPDHSSAGISEKIARPSDGACRLYSALLKRDPKIQATLDEIRLYYEFSLPRD